MVRFPLFITPPVWIMCFAVYLFVVHFDWAATAAAVAAAVLLVNRWGKVAVLLKHNQAS